MSRFLLLLIPLAACQTALPPPADCAATAAALSTRIGTPVAQIDATGPQGRRVIGPGDAITMDYAEGRLNLETDANGNLVRAYCG